MKEYICPECGYQGNDLICPICNVAAEALQIKEEDLMAGEKTKYPEKLVNQEEKSTEDEILEDK